MKPIVTLYESISLNGMITGPDDDTSYFAEVSFDTFVGLVVAAGAMVWGRRTHEKYVGPLTTMTGIQKIVLTSNREFEVPEGWQLAASPEEAFALAAEAGSKELLVAGGAVVNTAFARAGLLDRAVIDVAPVVIGEGLPIFETAKFDLHLELQDVKRPKPGVVQLHYDVRKG